MGGKVVAIDIGSKNIHMAEGLQKGIAVELDKLVQLSTPTNSFIEGRIEDKQVLKEIIRNGLEQNNIKTKNIIFSMQGASVITREIMLPEVNRDLIQGMVKYEMEQYLPDVINNYFVEHRVLGTMIDGDVRKLRIRAAAMPKNAAQDFYDLAKDLKLNPLALDIHLNAISKLFTTSTNINFIDIYSPEKTVAVIDFGHRNTMINIISNGVIEFSRPVSYGSRDLDTAIAGFFDMPVDKAEQKKIQELKIDKNIQIDAQQGIMQAVRSIFQQWMSEIQKVFHYYASRNQFNKISVIYLYGGGSRLKGLPEYIKQLLDVSSVIRINSMGNIKLNGQVPETDVGNYLNAIGAMIRF